MKKRTKGLMGLIVCLIIAIQFWPIGRTNPPVISDIQAPTEVKKVLRLACYNCHSNETQWPWYSRVAPVSWLLIHDVSEARAKLNFSDWEAVPIGDRSTLVRHIWREVENGEMPLPMYRILHPEAHLSEIQKSAIRDWAISNSQ
jgi:hypothetical protein